MSDNEQQYDYASEANDDEEHNPAPQKGQPQGQRTMQGARQNRQQNQQLPAQTNTANGQLVPQNQQLTGTMGGNAGAIRQSRIKDRPVPKETRDSSLKIKIELDLEVEVDLYARVKGDVTIGLM